MKSETWHKLEEICFDALARAEGERRAYLDEMCGSDQALRSEAERLLQALESDSDFLEEPIVQLTGDQPPEAGTPDSYIGPYRIVRPIGEGGMGRVFLATKEGEGFEQTVAVKVIRRGLDSANVVRRFHLERRILADLDHPGIARLQDGGITEDGRPYLVMEFVDGERIDEYCDREILPVRRRLELIRAVCDAVQHAHQNLVLHRDLKPSNILVTRDGSVKLLDFGVGKILDPELAPDGLAPPTRTELRMLTPEYASPEQVEGRPVSTASDVYSLGVLSYQLLCGHPPYAAGPSKQAELEQAVLVERPRRPSERVDEVETRSRGEETETITPEEVSMRRRADPRRLRRSLSGDLDNIVLRALRKEPERRYPSAAALSEDIGRHLEGLPVRARPDTLSYRAGKFVRRNAAGVVAAAAIAAALAGSAIWTGVQNARVRAEAARATAERDKALEVQGFLMETFGAVGPEALDGDDVAAKALLDAQSEALTSYDDRPELKAEMQYVLADGYQRLGFPQDAEPVARASLRWRERELPAEHPDIALGQALLGWIERELGNAQEAERLLRTAAESLRPHRESNARPLSRVLNDLGVVLSDQSRYEEEGEVLREALAIRREMYGDRHRSVGITANNLAVNLWNQGDGEGAIEFADLSVAALSAALGPDHARVWQIRANRAAIAGNMGYTPELEEQLRELEADARRIFGTLHRQTAWVQGRLAAMLRGSPAPEGQTREQRLEEAEDLLTSALEIQEAVLGPNHPDLISTHRELGSTTIRLGRIEDAAGHRRRAVALSRSNFGDATRTGLALLELAETEIALGNQTLGDALHHESMTMLRDNLGEEHPRTAAQMLVVGHRLLELRQLREARPLLAQAERVLVDQMPIGHAATLRARLNLAELLVLEGDTARADSVVKAARADWTMDESTTSTWLRDLSRITAR